ncbi:SCG1 protein, partial [Rhipidura dahli]|nr:SCG1 protein [Rhipidura dahli]
SGTMEGKEVSPSHTSESSTLDLPSLCDLAEHFLPPHSSENSEELYPSPPPGASAVPVEKDRTEEMVTRCIVEVLSNALSKPNAPSINPECKEILKKSDKNYRERSENNQPEVRHPKDPAETEKHPAGSMEKEQRQAEEESKKYMEGGDEEKLAREEGKSKEEEAEHQMPAQGETLHTEIKKHYQEIGREEERNYHSEEESKEGKCCEDVEAAVLSKKSHSEGVSVDEFHGGNDHSPRGRWHLEEGMQSPYKQIQEGEEGEEERSEKYVSQERGFSHQQEREESEESEEREEEKEPYKSQAYHGKHRAGDSYEEKRGHGVERGEPAGGSHPGEANLWEQWKHRQKHQEESEEKGGYAGRRGPEELQEEGPAEQGSEEHGDSWQQSQESREEENKRHHHSEESNEKWREERRHHDGSHRSEGRTYLADENEEELDRYPSKEKQHRARGRSRSGNKEGEGSQKAYARERKGQARRHYSTEESLEEEEEVEKKHHSSAQMENEEEERYAEMEEYRDHLPTEKEKRTAASYRPFYPLLWWKSQHLDKRDSAGEQLLEGREEGRPALGEKSLFPEYNDYEWWSEKQIQSALNHRRTEKRNPGKTNRYDVERQYNKMDQLAQLLNYRKKSAEFPELYSSGEDLKKRHIAGNDRSLSQRPLMEEEEKELENLATMDLELQKIAEKINSLRRG